MKLCSIRAFNGMKRSMRSVPAFDRSRQGLPFGNHPESRGHMLEIIPGP